METAVQKQQTEDAKRNGIFSYITIIGLIIAYSKNKENRSELASFHIRQNIGLFVIGIASSVLGFIPYAGVIISSVLGIAFLIGWIIGLLGALKGEKKGIPVVGEMFQKWFSTI